MPLGNQSSNSSPKPGDLLNILDPRDRLLHRQLVGGRNDGYLGRRWCQLRSAEDRARHFRHHRQIMSGQSHNKSPGLLLRLIEGVTVRCVGEFSS